MDGGAEKLSPSFVFRRGILYAPEYACMRRPRTKAAVIWDAIQFPSHDVVASFSMT